MTVVDTSLHSVPLEEIVFDTFGQGSIPYIKLTDATDEDIINVRDRIPPLNDPKYTSIEAVDFLDPTDLILSYSSGGKHYAYPFQMLNFHEFVNDEIDGIPILVSYCPLCRSGIVFDRRVDGMVLTFGNTGALYESNAVAYDKETGSYWYQAGGRAIVGPLTGKRMKPLPSLITTWAEWTSLHPDGLVLSTDTGYSAPYQADYFARYEVTIEQRGFAFPVSEEARDPRLGVATHVLVVMPGDSERAYNLDGLGDAVVNDTISGHDVVVFSLESGPSGAAYLPFIDGQQLTFQLKQSHFVDDQTGSTWNLAGQATAGSLEGESLEPLPSLFTFWFTAVVAFPQIDIYTP